MLFSSAIQLVDSGFFKSLFVLYLLFYLGLADYGLQDTSILPPILVSEVSLEHTYVFVYRWSAKPKIFTLYLALCRRSCPLKSTKDLKQSYVICNPKDIWNFFLKFPCNLCSL